MGFSREHRLQVWTMRLRALEPELGGPTAHRRFVARQKFLHGAASQAVDAGTRA